MSNFELMIEKRDGSVVPFQKEKINSAIVKAALATGVPSEQIETRINGIAGRVLDEVKDRFEESEFSPNVENIHDIVEKHLMVDKHYDVAKAYILYRAEKRRQDLENKGKTTYLKKLQVNKLDGKKVFFNPVKLKNNITRLSSDLKEVDQNSIFDETVKNVYDGVSSEEIDRALILAATSLMERDPEYNILAARFFNQRLRKEVTGKSVKSTSAEAAVFYKESFITSIETGVEEGILDERMLEFDLESLSEKLNIERDKKLGYMAYQTLYERYFTKTKDRRLEMPQSFYMRVAMGLALNEGKDKEKRAVEFYDVMSNHLLSPSTPTLFHAGLTHAQLSSCYLSTVPDDLDGIYKSIANDASLAKWSGGLGNDWTNVRGTGAWIKSTRVESQGVIPFLKISNASTAAINRSGKRRGATCVYLESWHYDFEDFIELKKNVGDERRRCHDLNIAAWLPDLFMKRVRDKGSWTLFSPDETPDLHDLYGAAFEKAYVSYERKAKRGKIKKYKTVEAVKLWRRILTMLFETGHPFIGFKDSCNIRSPQDHEGVIHSSNLCTEITLNTKATTEDELGEVAVCNLCSIVLPNHITKKKIDIKKITSTVKTAMRMLDNVVDLCYYPIPEAKNSNEKHRPVGLGIMGLQDAIYRANINFEESHDFVDELMEIISFHAISCSSDLAVERGSYSSFAGSKWERSIFPLDTLNLLEEERGEEVKVSRKSRLDWDGLKSKVKEQGMRNSNTMAIAPTATISTLTGCIGACIEPVYANVYTKSNMSGDFTVTNEYLIDDLKKANLWNKDMLDMLKYYGGSVQKIDAIPAKIKRKYKQSFEIDQKIAVELNAIRSKWIDQSQSFNLFFAGSVGGQQMSGKAISDAYFQAWESGCKTCYYLRTTGASQIEKSTLDADKFGFTQKREEVKVCRIDDPDCEACQ